MADDDVLQPLQTAIVTRLQTDSWFDPTQANYVPVISEDKGLIDNQIAAAVARTGIYLLVQMGEAYVDHPNMRGPFFSNVEFILEVGEHVMKNRGESGTGKTALQDAHRACRLLHHPTPDDLSVCLLVGRDAIVISPPPEGATAAYTILIQTKGGIAPS